MFIYSFRAATIKFFGGSKLTTETKEDTEPTEIALQLKEEYFVSVNLNDLVLEGKINDSSSTNFINVQAKNIEVKVALNNDLKVSLITIKYIDAETNFNVSISVTYNY